MQGLVAGRLSANQLQHDADLVLLRLGDHVGLLPFGVGHPGAQACGLGAVAQEARGEDGVADEEEGDGGGEDGHRAGVRTHETAPAAGRDGRAVGAHARLGAVIDSQIRSTLMFTPPAPRPR